MGTRKNCIWLWRATVNLVVGIVTFANKMSLLIEFAEEQLDTEAASKINKVALANLITKNLNNKSREV